MVSEISVFANKIGLMFVPIAYGIGKGALVGASAIGLGALCYYGIGLGNEANIYNQSM